MSVEKSNYKELSDMFKIDDDTKKKIKRLNSLYRTDDDNVVEYFNNLFNIIHKDILIGSRNRYIEYIKKNIELKKSFKSLCKNKNLYKYDIYMNLYNNIKEQKEINKSLYYGRRDGLYKSLGKASLLMAGKTDNEKILNRLNKSKQYIINYYN